LEAIEERYMKCEEFWSQTPEGSGVAAPEWSAHLQACPACAAAWERQQNIASALRKASAEWSRMEAPARVEGRVRSAFRAQAGAVKTSFRDTRPWLGVLAWATAVATVLVLAISLAPLHEPPSAAPRRAATKAAILASLQELPDGLGADGGLEGGFVPLPNVEQLNASEQGDLVRVELPRSAMLALGFEVSPERAAERVQAEVIYGPDGVARAVRFLDDAF
jgi:hypothetical protein